MSVAQQRMDKGLCPRCGEDAAPYRLCGSHRLESRLVRSLKKMERQGALKSTGRGANSMWSNVEGVEADTRWSTPVVPPDNDKRFRPRLGNVPADVEKELIGIMTEAGEPLTVEQIMAAWERLRQKRNRSSIAGDMKRIIKADQKRLARLERNRQRIMA